MPTAPELATAQDQVTLEKKIAFAERFGFHNIAHALRVRYWENECAFDAGVHLFVRRSLKCRPSSAWPGKAADAALATLPKRARIV